VSRSVPSMSKMAARTALGRIMRRISCDNRR
jgi:hypothetical protein